MYFLDAIDQIRKYKNPRQIIEKFQHSNIMSIEGNRNNMVTRSFSLF